MKDKITRRELLGKMGRMAYVAPTLTVLAIHSDNLHAFSIPCPPNDPCNTQDEIAPGIPAPDSEGNG